MRAMIKVYRIVSSSILGIIKIIQDTPQLKSTFPFSSHQNMSVPEALLLHYLPVCCIVILTDMTHDRLRHHALLVPDVQ